MPIFSISEPVSHLLGGSPMNISSELIFQDIFPILASSYQKFDNLNQ